MEKTNWGWKRILITSVVTVLFIMWAMSIFAPLILVIIGASPEHPIFALLFIGLGTFGIIFFILFIVPRLFKKYSQVGLSKFNKKALVYSLIALMAILFIGSYPNILPPQLSKACMLLAELILMILILWAAFSFQTRGSYITDRYPEEFDRLAETFNQTANEAIAKMLGKEAYLKLYPEEMFSANLDKYFQEGSKSSAVKSEAELRFYRLAKNANFEALREDFKQAEECLREALALKPQTFLLWMRLAEVSERLGAGPEAIAAYERALALAPEKPEVKDFLRAQIRFVRTRGPRKQLPIQGISYVSV